MLKSRRNQYTVVDQDSVRALLSRVRDISEIRKNLSADLIVSIRLQTVHGDSAMLLIQSTDYTNTGPFRGRSAVGRVGLKSQVLANLDQVLLSTLTSLDEMARAPATPTGPRRGPFTIPPIPPL